MKRKVLAAFVCLIMLVALLPVKALEEDASSVWIWGLELTSATPFYHNGVNGAQGTVDNDAGNSNYDYNAYFNAENSTLIIKGLDVKNSDQTKTISIGGESVTLTYAIYADGSLFICVHENSTITTTAAVDGNENAALFVNGNMQFIGPASLTATSGAGESTFGVYALGSLGVLDGTLEGRSGDASAAVTAAESYGVSTMSALSVFGGCLIGTAGTATASERTMSAGIDANVLTLSSGEITATGNTATATYALSYGMYVSSLNITGGTVTTNGGAATGGDNGSFSAGVAARRAEISGGTFTAQGGRASATGEAVAHSSGIYTEATNLIFSGGTVNATGGAASGRGGESCGIKNGENHDAFGEHIDGGTISVSGTADVTANGGNAASCFGLVAYESITVSNGKVRCTANGTAPVLGNYGVNVSNGYVTVHGGSLTATAASATNFSYGMIVSGSISIDGGELTAKSENAALTMALGVSLDKDDNNISAKGSTSSDGSNPVNYVATDNAGYKWVRATPPPTVTLVAVNPASVSVEKGGTQTFNAAVTGLYDPAQTVTWTVEGGVTGTGIDADGELTVAANETATTLTVKATSTVNTAMSGTASVTVTYRIIQGAGGTWTKGGSSGLGFTADAEYSKFTTGGSVMVDGSTISSDNYTTREGSTIVTLKPAYLQTLSVGIHTLRIYFDDGGYAETSFTIALPAATPGRSNPSTGFSETDAALWLSPVLLAFGGLAASLCLRRRKEN